MEQKNKGAEELILKISKVVRLKTDKPYIYEQVFDEERNINEYIGFPLNKKINYTSYFCKSDEVGKVNCYEIWDSKDKNEFLGITQHIDCVINDDGIKCMPINDEEIKKKVVCLPSEIKRFTSELELDAKIKQFITKWLDVDEEYKYIAVQNIKSFWLYDKFETINYLRALGDTGTGKSRFLHTFGFLAYKPLFCSGATTVSPIFRLITKWGGTVIIDEADMKKSDESEDFVKLLNQGYEKNASIMRCNPNDKTKIDFFNPYCPKIIATRRTFDDKAVESRCMTTLMQQTNRRDIPFNLNINFYNDALEIRNMLLYYRFINYNKINVFYSENPEIKERMKKYEPRLQQVNNILLCLFENNKIEQDIFFKYMELKQKEILQEREESFEGWIINAIAQLIIEKISVCEPYPYITSQMIANKLNENEGRTHHEYNNRSIGRYLKTLGFHIKTKRIGNTTPKIIVFEESKNICSIFKRYISDGTFYTKIEQILINNCNCSCFVVSNVSLCSEQSKILEMGTFREKSENGLCTETNETNETKKHNILTKKQLPQETKVKFFKENKGENKDIFIEKFGLETMEKMLNNGEIFEYKKNHLNMIE